MSDSDEDFVPGGESPKVGESDAGDNRKSSSKSRKSKTKNKNKYVDSDADSTDESNNSSESEGFEGQGSYSEELEDDEEEERPQKSKKKRRKKSGASRFFEDAAFEDDDEEEDELSAEEGFEKVVGKDVRDSIKDTPRKSKFQNLISENDSTLEERYRDRGDDEFYEGTSTAIAYADSSLPRDVQQQALMPSVQDPKLWMVKCVSGSEKEVTVALMRRFIEMEYSEQPLQIKSAMCLDNLKGYIYVEAHKSTHVQRAIKGLQALAMGQWKQTLVPINQMMEVMTCVKKVEAIPRGTFVRMKRTMYKDDLAQVLDCNESSGKIILKMIPRLDIEKIRADANGTSRDLKRRKGRPPQRFFDVNETPNYYEGGFILHFPVHVYDRNKYNRSGFLIKTVDRNAVLVDGVQPSIEEMRKFSRTVEGEDVDEDGLEANSGSSSLKIIATDKKIKFEKRDRVKVIEGDLKGLLGVVDSVDRDTIYVKPNIEALKGLLPIPINQLVKYFETGDHVKVINGIHKGESGLVTNVEDTMAYVLGDLSKEEFQVYSKDIQLCEEVASGLDSLGQFQLNDLVLIDSRTVGCIVKIELDAFRVLTQTNESRRLNAKEVKQMRSSKNARALDSQQNSVTVGDSIDVINGPYKGKRGIVKHIYRSFLFIKNNDFMENSGIFSVRTSHSLVSGVTKNGNNGNFAPFSTNRGRGAGLGGQRGRGRGRDPLMNASVVITDRNYKGYMGIVKEVTDAMCRVELHTNAKMVNVARNKVRIKNKDGTFQEPMDGGVGMSNLNTNQNMLGSRTPAYGSRTPAYGSRTPAYGSRTPAYGSRTPAYGSQTPAYGSQTPLHNNNDDAWDPKTDINVFTPMSDNHHSADTPMNTSTPAGLSMDTPYTNYTTPMNNPQTPMGVYNNPTTPYSGAYTQPTTPGVGARNGEESIGTPYSAYSVATPGGYSAATPQGVEHGYGMQSTNTSYNPQTPGVYDMEYNDQTHNDRLIENSKGWLFDNIQVKIVTGEHMGEIGVVKNAQPERRNASVHLPSLDITLTLSANDLEHVQPSQKERCKVIKGELAGKSGVIRVIDVQDKDTFVLLDGGEEKYLSLDYVAREVKD